MMLQIPQVLTKAQVAQARTVLDAGPWVDGNLTSGFQAARAKTNEQLPQDCEAARAVGETILQAVEANPVFVSAALPQVILPPMFNRYGEGMGFKDHVDNAIRRDPVSGRRLRTDLSATLFLSEPDDYDGGELVVNDLYGDHVVKLEAGDMILYPSASLHHVTPVTRGVRTASFFWIQSLIRDDAKRTLLLEMDVAIQRLTRKVEPDDEGILSLTGVYHNLLRQWAEV
ncbi:MULTISPECIES: Fe2+-dependent dioxygenase [unclassified Caulobacter]|uniref:Fe2+-dependent dioxygenase n=1 Tax=unclassified Caulobacter TaxID=2648921 RepID=UPI0006F62991|nr:MULTISPECIES: Fe2+-dependent dioxygenase [unclassified Caulobacter]KQV62239.1 PKHD-type hydroxylase [Caulobacter sp. Root342]KQV63159.1 PKHD-type hydroxylase [Caulobacter sp. Root343]